MADSGSGQNGGLVEEGLDDEQTTFATEPTKVNHIPDILPHERVFPIQIGSELFKLSGASISSDAPSYFSQYFRCQINRAKERGEDPSSAIRTLYIDRDPVTFKDISLHLQGYHVTPRDATHFVRLFADAQFYHLPKLISQLHEEAIVTTVGDRQFRIPRDLFSDPGNSPNFFTLGFAAFFSSPGDLFPGLDREGLLRPPSIVPPSVPNRSADTFAELLRLLRGYPVDIRSEAHRADLLRDCRYFNFKGLEQRLIPHALSFNLARGRHEIALRLRDILKSGVSVSREPAAAAATATDHPRAGWVCYARPYVDHRAYELVVEIGDESTRLQISRSPGGGAVLDARAQFFGETRVRVARLLDVVAAKFEAPGTAQPISLLMSPQPAGGGSTASPPAPEPGNSGVSSHAGEFVKVLMDQGASVVLDGRPWAGTLSEEEELQEREENALRLRLGSAEDPDTDSGPRKRRRLADRGAATEEWTVRNGLWRLRVQGAPRGTAAPECCLVAVKLDALSSERARNAQRSFLGA